MSDNNTSERRPGRPQTLTDSTKKRKNKVLDSKSNKARINIGDENRSLECVQRGDRSEIELGGCENLLDRYSPDKWRFFFSFFVDHSKAILHP